MNAEEIAHVCHEANRALQEEQNDPSIPVSPGWAEVDPETKESAVNGVLGIIGGNTPQESHANWMAFKLAHGWKRGPVKDEELKEHPLLVPYHELPESQQLKDHLFSAIVNALVV